MEQEILLTGGRITQGVARRGDRVYRPMCANSDFVHRVLVFLEKSGRSACRDFTAQMIGTGKSSAIWRVRFRPTWDGFRKSNAAELLSS